MAERILIVDDNKDFVEINKTAFEIAGYEVLTAHDGEVGLQKAGKEKPDAIVLDVMMKSKTEGFEIARKLHMDNDTRLIPVLMLTGIRQEMGIPYKFEPDDDYLPVVKFIEKPITPDRLIEKVKQLLEKKRNG